MVFDFTDPIKKIARDLEMGLWANLHMRFLTPIKRNLYR